MRISKIYRGFYLPKINVFGEGEGDGGGTGGGTNTETPKMFTQEQVNAFIKADKDKTKKDNEKLLSDFNKLKEEGLTKENLDFLQGRIAELENEGKTKEQIAEEKRSRLSKDYESKLAAKTSEADSWKNNYTSYRLETEIKFAATDKKARNPDQVLAILKPHTSLREVLGDDKKPTGSFDTRVKWQDKDKDGNPITLDLSVTEAVNRMFESESHANLFDSGTNGGLGGFNSSSRKPGEKDPSDMTGEEYIAWRKKKKAGR